MSTIKTRLRQLFATLAAVTAINPILKKGEVWIERDASTGFSTGRRKVGDGVTAFVDLPFEPTGTNAGATTEEIQDAAAALLTGGTHIGVSFAYNDASNRIDATVTAAGATDLSIANRGATTLDVASSTGADVTLPAATNTQAGLATAAQVAKLEGVASSATANATDAQLRDRQTHTGEQAISTITGLSTSLAAKADLVGGVVPTSQIPSVALVEFLGAVASQAAMLALRGQPGDWAIRTDRATEWVIVANNGATLSDWYELPTGIAPVGSVNGQTGSVVLGTGDVAESGGNLYFTAARAISAALTGFVSGAGTVSETDSLLQAIQKIVGNLAGRALTGAVGSSGLTMSTGALLGRSTAGTGAIELISLGSGLTLSAGTLSVSAPEGIALTVSNRGEVATVGNNYVEKAVRYAGVVVGVTWELNPTTPSTGGSSAAMLYARRSGTKTNLLTANASLPVTTGIFTDVSATLTGTLTLAAGDSVGLDLASVGTGATGLIMTVYVRYS
jgi:hypothetical protein